MSDEFLPDDVRELSTCTRLVYLALEDADHPLTYDEVAERTGVSKRTIRKVMRDLRDLDVVETAPHPTNLYAKAHGLTADDATGSTEADAEDQLVNPLAGGQD